MRILLFVGLVLAAIILLGWLGLRVRPRSFAPHAERTPKLATVPLPAGLPAPVAHFFRRVYGERIPIIETVVIKGRADMTIGITMPARFVFVHNAGKDYRHYFEATWFGLPIMKVNERYIDGKSLFELPFATYDDDASTNQGANLAVWAEAAWFPAIWATDPRVRWEPIDDRTALMFVPFRDKEENFVLRFNPETGLLDSMEAMRYRDAGDQAPKIPWITRSVPGPNIEGTPLSAAGTATWLDQGRPWAVFRLEDVVYNVDVRAYIRQKGK
jgi:hypothetical protein